MRIGKRLLALLLLTVLVGPALAEDEPLTPTTLKGGKIISAVEAKVLVEQGKTAIFDMRRAMNFEKGHLKGAISLPYDQKSAKVENFDASVDKFDLSKLPGNKSTSLIFYSDGPTGWKSYKAAVLAIRNGHSNVNWFRGGTAEWIDKGFSLE